MESSLILNLVPDKNKPFCKRQFYAPESHSFYVRLQRIPPTSNAGLKNLQQNGHAKKYGNKKANNITDSCSLSISHSLHGEVLPPWRLDPCELEVISSKEEPMRLLQGRLNIVWNHFGNQPGYRLVMTVIGNGFPCLEKGKHSCLEVDDVPLLCISKELVCDGIRHCPSPVNAFSDEDSEMCAKLREQQFAENPVQMVFRKYIQTTFKSFFNNDATEVPPIKDTSTLPAEVKQLDVNEALSKVSSKPHKSTLTGLSKYGPWGYLFLGMLLCGGALLVCGLWECCCRSQKQESSDLDEQEHSAASVESGVNGSNANTTNGTQTLPTYEDLDPPPAYSVLFPNQKPAEVQTTLSQDSERSSFSFGSIDHVQTSSSETNESGSHVHTQTQNAQ
ncbi:uncharacterized protein LOC129764290 isoform X2 [Toxorhynchites rutilus septentrionalis]|nr:uncharacterized protein LOC129764290 isoform X2 [Toxorhynchites rutilus septentrionalis]XP_055619201.1 uncharacterized protein LOC129764290 isoform X2 [Toxorhynchites rutilus septentrionalis]XP_055619202.1 uncharacterized protein LOC129764290 isoform X2 [Toxorhynchites rutilus septentrionalis]